MDFVPILAAAAIVKACIDLLRYASGKDWKSVATQIVSWAAGVGVSLLFAASDFADGFKLGDTGVTLGNANTASVLLFGLTFGAVANTIVDGLKAFDNTDSQKKPPLLSNGA